MINENLIYEKYDFQCSCGNECTVYAEVLLKKGYQCPECEKEYSDKTVIDRGTVLYEIDKSAVMECSQDFVDAKSRIRKIIEYRNRTMDKPVMQIDYEEEKNLHQEKKIGVFISYSHEDAEYKEMLIQHLSPLKRSGKIAAWSDEELLPGSKLDEKIKEQLRQNDIIILMVSSSFIDSDYCYETEMREAIAKAKAGECKIVPVIVRPCMWSETPFKDFLALPHDGKAISQYENKDEAYTEIVQGVKRLIEEMEQVRSTAGKC